MSDDADPTVAADAVPDAGAIAGLMADGDRRRVLAALVLGASTVDDVRLATGLPVRAAATALHRLVDGGLVERVGGGGHVVLGEAFRRAAIAAALPRPAPDPVAGDVPEDQARVLRTYLRGGRLTGIPVQRSKKRVVLDRLAQDFEPGARYTERQVNAMLRRYHDDVAALRRYLVDEGFLDRAAGEYWRAGGTIPGRSPAAP
ncbi:MAG TPA: DUF2087 domain-containing protein [Acidimicrobiales bacterium]